MSGGSGASVDKKTKAHKIAAAAIPNLEPIIKHPHAVIAVCDEDKFIEAPFEFGGEDKLYEMAVKYNEEAADTKNWKDSVRASEMPQLPFPRSGIAYSNRIHRKYLDVEIRGDAKTGGDQLSRVLDPFILSALFRRCRDKKCAHRIVPLSIHAVEWETWGMPDSHTKFAVQITTEAFQTMNDAHSILRSPAASAAAEANSSPVQRVIDHKMEPFNAWVRNDTVYVPGPSALDEYGFVVRSNARSEKRAQLYRAHCHHATPENYDIIRALPYRCSDGFGPEKHIKRFEGNKVYIQQPDDNGYTSGVVPYLVTKDLPRNERWLNPHSFVSFTRKIPVAEQGKKGEQIMIERDHWIYTQDGVFNILGDYANRLTRMKMVMNIDGNMTIDFRPLATTEWKPTGDFGIQLKLEFVYLVING